MSSPSVSGNASGPTSVVTSGPGFTRVKRRRVFEEICDQIRSKVSRGEYRPGDKLPSERELALELGVGRPAVREAIRTLENAGVLVLKNGLHGGAFVRDGNPQTVTQSLHDLLSLGHFSLPALMEARRAIIGSVLRLACERGTDEDFDAIEACIERIEQFDTRRQYLEKVSEGTEFFRLLTAAAQNPVLLLLSDSLTTIVRLVASSVRPANNTMTDPLRRELLACLRKRNVAQAQVYLERFFETVEGEIRRALATRRTALPLAVG